MITKFKIFENIEIKQQPFFLSKGDRLFISDDFAKFITKDIPNYLKDDRDDFFGDVRKTLKSSYSGKSWDYFKNRILWANISVPWSKEGMRNAFKMNIYIYRWNNTNYLTNESGKFRYYIGGSSGDSKMRGKNMIRATRQCNINLIKKFFPIFEHIPYAHKKLQKNKFFDVIKNAVKEKPELSKYLTEGDYPEDFKKFQIELAMNKYNI